MFFVSSRYAAIFFGVAFKRAIKRGPFGRKEILIEIRYKKNTPVAVKGQTVTQSSIPGPFRFARRQMFAARFHPIEKGL